jgi:hypothetical protein
MPSAGLPEAINVFIGSIRFASLRFDIAELKAPTPGIIRCDSSLKSSVFETNLASNPKNIIALFTDLRLPIP